MALQNTSRRRPGHTRVIVWLAAVALCAAPLVSGQAVTSAFAVVPSLVGPTPHPALTPNPLNEDSVMDDPVDIGDYGAFQSDFDAESSGGTNILAEMYWTRKLIYYLLVTQLLSLGAQLVSYALRQIVP